MDWVELELGGEKVTHVHLRVKVLRLLGGRPVPPHAPPCPPPTRRACVCEPGLRAALVDFFTCGLLNARLGCHASSLMCYARLSLSLHQQVSATTAHRSASWQSI